MLFIYRKKSILKKKLSTISPDPDTIITTSTPKTTPKSVSVLDIVEKIDDDNNKDLDNDKEQEEDKAYSKSITLNLPS